MLDKNCRNIGTLLSSEVNLMRHPVIWFAPVTLVLLALFPLPYEYYVF